MLLTWRTPPAPAAPPRPMHAPAVVVDLKESATSRGRGASGAGERPGPAGEQHRVPGRPRDARGRRPVRSADAALAALRADPAVEIAEAGGAVPDPGQRDRDRADSARPRSRSVSAGRWTPNDPRYAEQWNFRQINAEKAWEVTRGKGAVVAVIDTGVAFETDDQGCYQAKDFRAHRFVPGYDFIHKQQPSQRRPGPRHPRRRHYRGVDQQRRGRAPASRSKRRSCRSRCSPKRASGSTGDIAEAIRWAADHGANVINMSLGSPFPSADLHPPASTRTRRA